MQKRQFLVTAASWTTALSTPWLAGCAASGKPEPGSASDAQAGFADAIYFGGPILTMNDAQPQVQALAVRGTQIAAVGDCQAVQALRGPDTRMVDLQGRTLIPGFVDPHSHLGGVGLQAIAANLLPPPDGPNASIAELQQTLREYIKTSPEVKQLGLAFGFGYDDSQLKERRHPTRDDLDAVSRTVPIAVIHQSGHFGSLNSAALKKAGIGADTPNPEGGVIRRKPGSKQPDGVLEENAFFFTLSKIMPKLSEEQSMEWLEKAQELYLQYGYTTVQDGRADPGAVATTIAAAKAGRLKVDVVSYPDITQLGDGAFMHGPYYSRSYTGHFRIGGVKLTLDGSPQGKTAWLTQPYLVPPKGQKRGYRGYGVLPDARVNELVAKAVNNGWQILVHGNGDAAIDQMIAAVRASGLVEKTRAARPDPETRPDSAAQGPGDLSLAVPHACLLLGRLAPRFGAGRSACREHLAHGLGVAAGHALYLAPRRAGRSAVIDSGAGCDSQPCHPHRQGAGPGAPGLALDCAAGPDAVVGLPTF